MHSMSARGRKQTFSPLLNVVVSVASYAGLIGLLLLPACASTSPGARETITLARRNWFGGCISNCPNYDITVWDDGHVVARRHSYGAPDRVERFRVSPTAVSAFWKVLLPFRPPGSGPVPPVCHHDLPPEEAPFVMKVTEIEIRWIGAEHRTRLVACDVRESVHLLEAIRQALWSVNLYYDGRRRP